MARARGQQQHRLADIPMRQYFLDLPLNAARLPDNDGDQPRAVHPIQNPGLPFVRLEIGARRAGHRREARFGNGYYGAVGG